MIPDGAAVCDAVAPISNDYEVRDELLTTDSHAVYEAGFE